MAMKPARGTVFVAGSSSAVPRPGRANSGYVLRADGLAIAIDFGNGVFSRIRELFEPSRLDAVVISHMHADHFFDIVPLRYALRYEMQRNEPLPIYLPPGGAKIAKAVASAFKDEGDFFEGVLDLREYAPEKSLAIGSCRVQFAPARHYIPAYAMRFETPAGVLGYSADTAPAAAVSDLVRGADLFLCEAALGPAGIESGTGRGHSNAREAGELAAAAAAKHLVLTHYGANADSADLRKAAAGTFAGEIAVADDGMEFALPFDAHGTGRKA